MANLLATGPLAHYAVG